MSVSTRVKIDITWSIASGEDDILESDEINTAKLDKCLCSDACYLRINYRSQCHVQLYISLYINVSKVKHNIYNTK